MPTYFISPNSLFFHWSHPKCCMSFLLPQSCRTTESQQKVAIWHCDRSSCFFYSFGSVQNLNVNKLQFPRKEIPPHASNDILVVRVEIAKEKRKWKSFHMFTPTIKWQKSHLNSIVATCTDFPLTFQWAGRIKWDSGNLSDDSCLRNKTQTPRTSLDEAGSYLSVGSNWNWQYWWLNLWVSYKILLTFSMISIVF